MGALVVLRFRFVIWARVRAQRAERVDGVIRGWIGYNGYYVAYNTVIPCSCWAHSIVRIQSAGYDRPGIVVVIRRADRVFRRPRIGKRSPSGKGDLRQVSISVGRVFKSPARTVGK
jgi:hypothetical protein